jgi:DNA-binding transcriptional LysR family regulator
VTAVRQAVDDVNDLMRGRLVVGMVSAGVVPTFFDALAAFHRAHPGVEIALVEGNSDRLIERVRTGALDLALVGTAGTPPPDLDALTIISEGLVAAVAVGHPLARRRRVTLADISAYPIVCLPEGTGIRTVFDEACTAKGVQADIALQASAPDAVAGLAIRGLGVAILAASMAAGYEGRLKALTLHDVEQPAMLALVSTATKSPALRELVACCHEAVTRP